MAAEHLLALDLGTSSARCLVALSDGTPVHQSQGEYIYQTLADASELAREFSPTALWRLITRLIRESLAQAGLTGGDIAALGITSQRQAIAFLDKQGRELYIGPNMDLRGVFQGAAMDETFAREVYGTTGHLPSFFFASAKLEWFRHYRPQVFEHIARVCTLAAWVAHRLTGEVMDEPALLGEAGVLDIRRGEPAVELVTRLGFDPHWLPPLVPAGTIMGTVTPSVAQSTGLRPTTPVTLAGPDTQVALLGMGVTEPASVGIVAGWSAPVQQITARPIFDRRRRTWVGRHVLPERWVVEANPGDAGNVYAWLKGILAPKGDGYKSLEERAAQAPPGSEGVTAFLGVRPFTLSQPGLTVGGLLMPVPLTYQQIGGRHLARATLESIAYALRASLERVEQVSSQPANEIHVGGGMSHSDTFLRILADTLNRPLQRHPHNVSGVGAALAAATAAGLWPTLGHAAREAACQHTSLEPEALRAAEYQEYYQRWLVQLRRLESLHEALS